MAAVKRVESQQSYTSKGYQYRDVERVDAVALKGDADQAAGKNTRRLNNPLAVAMNYLHAAKATLKSNDDNSGSQTLSYLELASDALDDVAVIVKQQPANLSPNKKQQCDTSYPLQDAVFEAVSMALLHMDQRDISTVIKCKSCLPDVSIKRHHLHQLIINLMLYLANISSPHQVAKYEIELAAIQYGHVNVRLSARSNGLATGPARQAHTSKPARRVQTCQSILAHYGGKILQEPTISGELTFQFSLPTII